MTDQEIATLQEKCTTYRDTLELLEAFIADTLSRYEMQACGHPTAAMHTQQDGTTHCLLCEREKAG